MRFKKVFSNLELEGQGRGIIMGVTHLLLLGPFYTIQTNFTYFFAHDCKAKKYPDIQPEQILRQIMRSFLEEMKP